MTPDLKLEIQTELNLLGTDQQQRVLEFVRSLKRPAKGTPGSVLVQFAGGISADDLQQMEQAIEEGCEQVDSHEW